MISVFEYNRKICDEYYSTSSPYVVSIPLREKRLRDGVRAATYALHEITAKFAVPALYPYGIFKQVKTDTRTAQARSLRTHVNVTEYMTLRSYTEYVNRSRGNGMSYTFYWLVAALRDESGVLGISDIRA